MSYDRTYNATYDYGVRTKGTRAIVLHFTEGNGTEADVRYIAGPNVSRGVSCNFVITSDGKIWQLLDWSHAAGSIDPTQVRTTDDPPFTSPDGAKVTFGATAAKAALGDAWKDPNAAVVAVEIGGKAADGPTAAQTASITALVADFRSRYGPLAALGHRDFQDYKPCPGKLIRWAALGGHGAPEVDVDLYSIPGRKSATFAAGTPVYDKPGGTQTSTLADPTRRFDLVAQDAASAGYYLIDGGVDDPPGLMRWVKAADAKNIAEVATADALRADLRKLLGL